MKENIGDIGVLLILNLKLIFWYIGTYGKCTVCKIDEKDWFFAFDSLNYELELMYCSYWEILKPTNVNDKLS